MAWTRPTAGFFIAIVAALILMTILELRNPGGAERDGVFGLTTTRGDRLFITLLGAAFIHLGWLWVFGTPLWGAVAIAIAWGVFVFKWV